MCADIYFSIKISTTKNLYTIFFTCNSIFYHEINSNILFSCFSDKFSKGIQVYRFIFYPERMLKTEFRHPLMEWHLTAFKLWVGSVR